jgi:HSP20 family protein
MTAKNIRKKAPELQTQRVRETGGTCVVPAVDVYETEESVVVEADMPGVDGSGIEVKLDNGLLTLLGRGTRKPIEGVTQLYEEIVSGDFCRTFTVGEDLDESNISAVIADGVLVVTLPKSSPRRARKIVVK